MWRQLLTQPDQAAHVLGKLLSRVGAQRVLWGTDAIWYGSPEPQIMAMKAFEITPEFQDLYQYPALTDELKTHLFGLNAAELFGIDPIGDPMRSGGGPADVEHRRGGATARRGCAPLTLAAEWPDDASSGPGLVELVGHRLGAALTRRPRATGVSPCAARGVSLETVNVIVYGVEREPPGFLQKLSTDSFTVWKKRVRSVSGFEESGGGQHGEPVLVPGVAHLDLAKKTRADPGTGHRRPDPDRPQIAQDE